MGRRSLDDIFGGEPDLDEAALAALTDGEIAAQKAEGGYEIPAPTAVEVVLPAAEIRGGLGMTQEQFARALRIPVATLRNWEQNRALPDPAARSLLNAVARDPDAVLAAIDPAYGKRSGPQSIRRLA